MGVGLPVNLLNRLQSVLNAAARSIAGLRRSPHTTDTCQFPLVTAPERIKFKLTVIVYRALHRTALWYLSDWLSRVADMPSLVVVFGRQLPTNLLSVRRVLSQLANDHLLLLAQSCGRVPDDFTSATSLTVFRRKLKTHLFRQSLVTCLWLFS